MEPMGRTERVASQTSEEFGSRLTSRHRLVQDVIEVVVEAANSDQLEPWEYPQLEAGLGSFAAAIYGLPVTIESPSMSQFPSLARAG